VAARRKATKVRMRVSMGECPRGGFPFAHYSPITLMMARFLM
jgi:hypothetical protein